MPFLITLVIILASFSIASKYELKTMVKQPFKITTWSILQSGDTNETPEEPANCEEEEANPCEITYCETGLTWMIAQLHGVPHKTATIIFTRFQFSPKP